MRQKKWLRRLVLLVAGLFLAWIALCFWIAGTIVSPPRSVATLQKPFDIWNPVPGVPAWATPSVVKGTSRNVFIFSHGLGANRAFYASTATELALRGYDVVLLPMPGHDESPEQNLGFGPRESVLIKSTIDAVKAEHVVLVGCSLGGAATWLASDHPRVDGVVTESAFGRLDPVASTWFGHHLKVGNIIFRPVIWIVSWRLGLNPADINPVETARKWDHKKPALVIHAGDDQLIPISQGRELAQVTGAEFWEVPGSAHAQCQDAGEEYVDRVEEVMKRTISRGASK